jgi:hypothetical protein
MNPEIEKTQASQPGAGMAALGLLFAAAVAAVTGIHFSGGSMFCSTEVTQGRHIDQALLLVFVGGLVGSILLLLVRKRPRLRTAVSLGGVALLLLAMELVALDSARFTGTQSCGLLSSTETTIDERVYYLFAVWVVSVALLLGTALPGLGRPTRRQIIPVALAVWVVAVAVTLATAERGSSQPHGGKKAKIPPGTQQFAEPDHDHVGGKVRYNRTPPAGGPHNPVWLNCGIYARPVRNENAVHSLEHGTVWITYAPQLPPRAVTRLRKLVESHYRGENRYVILSPYPGLSRPVVASAWGAQLKLSGATDPRLAQFVDHFAGRGQGGEPGGYCSDGTGSPVG